MIKLTDTSDQYTTRVALNNHDDNSELLFNSNYSHISTPKKKQKKTKEQQEWVKRQNTAFFRVNLEQ